MWELVYRSAGLDAAMVVGALFGVAAAVGARLAWIRNARVFACAAILVGVATISGSLHGASIQADLVRDGMERCHWVEGEVAVIEQQRSDGRMGPDRITVRGEEVLVDLTDRVGYHTPIARGGVLSEGRVAKVCVFNSRAFEVWVQR